MNSIRGKLLRWLLIGQLLAVGLTGVITFIYVRSALENLFDDRLRQLAYSVPPSGEFRPSAPMQITGMRHPDEDFVIQVRRLDGTPLQQINRKEGTPDLTPEGFSSHWSRGMYWRSFVLRRGDRLIQASQPFSARLEMSTSVAMRAVAPVLVLILVLGGVVWIGVGRGLRPLQQMTSDLGQRRPFSLTPLETKGLVEEIRPLAQALNGLLERLGHALAGQRKFIADAAHELRTPLAAVQLQAQLLQRAASEEDRAQALLQIRAGTLRATHLVHQLLTLARMEPEDWQRPFAPVDLSALMKSVVAEQAPMAISRQIDLGVSRDEPLGLSGDVESLRIMLGNLVDNAIRYTPRGGRVDVALRREQEMARLEVLDSGPGIPRAERAQVFARFYRRPGTRETGSGLGLAIVQEVVARHRGEVELADAENGPGLRAIVRLPLECDSGC